MVLVTTGLRYLPNSEIQKKILKVIRDYLDIDEEALQVNLENEANSIALIANIPVKGFRRKTQEVTST